MATITPSPAPVVYFGAFDLATGEFIRLGNDSQITATRGEAERTVVAWNDAHKPEYRTAVLMTAQFPR